jgi:hypothetical protein
MKVDRAISFWNVQTATIMTVHRYFIFLKIR